MSYLVIYKEGGEEKKDVFSGASDAATHIEDLIRDKNISADDIDLHELTKVEYGVKHVPVVTLNGNDHHEEELEPEKETISSKIVEGIEDVQDASAKDESLEVFTFES